VVGDAQEIPAPAIPTFELPVVFEELNSEPSLTQEKEPQKPLRFGLKEEELNFVPLVVAEVPADAIESITDTSLNNEPVANGLMDMPVDCELVKPEMADDTAGQAESFLSLEVDCESIQGLPEEENIPIAMAELDVVYEVILPPPFDAINELDNETGILPKDDSFGDLQLPEWLMKQLGSAPPINLTPEDKGDYELQSEPIKTLADFQKLLMPIPARKTYDKEIEVQMHLLEDIELFGDSREVDLLKELQLNARHTAVKERIAGLLIRFSEPMSIEAPLDSDQLKLDDALPKFSIFSELFRHSDTESKLILLEEIATVGDEKEVAFLKELSDDPESLIREHSAKALLKLEALLAAKRNAGAATIEIDPEGAEWVSSDNEFDPLINEIEVRFKQSLNIFDIGFEMALAEEPVGEDLEQLGRQDEQDGSFWKAIIDFAQKIIEKTHG
jgi:hypothetical protein